MLTLFPPGTDKGGEALRGAANVEGDALPTQSIGVRGKNDSIKATGFLAGPNPFAGNIAIGAYGESDQQGVVGIANTPDGTGVYGGSRGGVATGVMGEASGATGVHGRAGAATGVGIRGENTHGGLAGKFDGNVDVHGVLTIKDNGDVVLADCAEGFQLAANCGEVAPGTVMVLEETGAIVPCITPYNTRVAGVVSGAGWYRPAIVLDPGNTSKGRVALSLIGKVYCLADATFGAISVGDLLTTSSTLGHAMKVNESARALGAVLGKALADLPQGKGLIPVLVALQ
jgi:hypothetical protein